MKHSQDYYNLKKSVCSYIDKYPVPDKKKNKLWLKRLVELKPFILIDKEKEKEYYKIRDTITLSNGGFAMKYVMRYSALLTDDVSINELFQEATIGILESIDTFDIKKNTSFTTYAYFHIRKRIIDFIKHNKLIRAPRDIARNMRHVNDIQSIIQVSKGIIPSAKEIMKELKRSKGLVLKEELIDKILVLLELSSGSGEAFISEYKDQTSTPEENDLFKNMEIHLLSSISNYSDILQKAICLRYGIGREFPHSTEEVKMMLNLKDKDLKLLDDNRPINI
jgi:RNA polymerase sigma factor (sigma-70 family)